MSSEQHPTYSTAKTPGEIIEAVARAVWWQEHGSTKCPAHMIPTEPALREYVRVSGGGWIGENPDDGNGPCLFVEWPVPSAPIDRIMASGRMRRPALRRPSNIATAHADWIALSKPRPEHPLRPLVRAWQQRPRPVQRNRRLARTMPTGVGMAKDRKGFLPPWYVNPHDGGQLALPGFGPDVQDLPTPALPLVLYDLGVGRGVEQRGRGAPLALRIWVEAVLSISLSDRRHIDGAATLEFPLKAIYPNGIPKRVEYYPRLEAAQEALAKREAKIPWEDPTTKQQGARHVVLINDIVTGRNPHLRVIVDLPPGAITGPTVSPRLAHWGVTAAPHYRALLGLAYRWWKPGQTHHPVDNRRDRHWIETQDPKRYSKVTDAEIVALVNPTSTRAQQRNLISESWRVLHDLVAAGEVRYIDGRLMPPAALPYIPRRHALKRLLARRRNRGSGVRKPG